MCVVVLLKHALKDLSIYCTFSFFYLLVKLFMLSKLTGLVNKDLQCLLMRSTVCALILHLLAKLSPKLDSATVFLHDANILVAFLPC